MNSQEVPIFGHTIDKSQVPPIHQKRILAFVNHFIINTCSFLNDFALKCESKFIDVERKLQKVEASLIIVESKLSSISGLENKETNECTTEIDTAVTEKPSEKVVNVSESQENIGTIEDSQESQNHTIDTGVKASEDSRYKKYFKMIQFGVPVNAVKMKMSADGFDPNILDNPDTILTDGIL